MEVLGKSKEELRAFCVTLGEPAYRGEQIYRALYQERKFDVAEMSSLPAAFRAKLAEQATITMPVVRQRFASRDGSVRYLLELNAKGGAEWRVASGEWREETKESANAEGAEEAENRQKKEQQRAERKGRRGTGGLSARPAAVEAVFMPSEGRQTICISTQAGCAVDCQFCMTAQLGLIRNLTPGEILGQVLLPLEEHKKELVPQTNVVLMGQGEPLLNYDNVMAAMRIVLDPKGMAIAPKRVTLSTSGIVPGIERLAEERVRPKLAISLNASNDEQRDALMPINRKYPLKMLLEACKKFPRKEREYVTFEYVLLGGVNDTAEDAKRVAKMLAPLGRVKVNLIPWNPGALPYKEPTEESIETFHKILLEKGVPAFTRYSRGRDVMAACGQLALKEVTLSPLELAQGKSGTEIGKEF